MPTSAELFFHDGAGKIIHRRAKTAAAQRQNIFSSRAPARTHGQKNDGDNLSHKGLGYRSRVPAMLNV